MRLGILGAGESGIGAALLASKLKYEVFVSDSGSIEDRYKDELNSINVPFEEGGHSFEILANVDLVIKSPGIPDSARIVEALQRHVIAVISEIEFASRHCDGNIIAITGTNGKTTTAMMCFHILDHAEISTSLCGNVGVSFARSVASTKSDWYVVEVSSFQLDNINSFKPNISVLLNITPDHLDRYGGSMEQYAAAKMRIAEFQTPDDVFVYDGRSEWLTDRISKAKVASRLVCVTDLIDSESFPFSGQHNAFNATCATIVASEVGVSAELISEGLMTFRKPDHRMQHVKDVDGVMYINDSKATNTDAAFYALEAQTDPVVWIVGGQDKGNDYTQLLQLVRQKVKAIICLGIANEKLFKAFSSEVEIMRETTSVVEAVEMAASIATAGNVVLLSPACASFDLFSNYKERGELFTKAVLALQV